MSHSNKHKPFRSKKIEIVGILMVLGLALAVALVGYSLVSAGVETLAPAPQSLAGAATPTPMPENSDLDTKPPLGTPPAGDIKPGSTPSPTRKFNPNARPTPTPTRTLSPTPTQTPTITPSPTPTLDLDSCNAAGCGAEAVALPSAVDNFDLFLRKTTPIRRVCPECPKNETLSAAQLNKLVAADAATLARLRQIVLSQETYQLAPGVVYIVYNNVHHIVIDLKQPGYVLRNIIPSSPIRGTLITPSYCLSPQSLVVTTADYHGLNGSNKTETGRDMFFHLGRAAFYEREGRFHLDVIRTRPAWDRTSISWGGGPIFMWNGQYDYNPEQEWFDRANLEHYRTTHWSKLTVAISKDRKYAFISTSYGLTLEQHAQNIIDLGQKWGIKMDRAMRFDGSESAYMAIRLGNYMVPILNLDEPLIVNCFAIEKPN